MNISGIPQLRAAAGFSLGEVVGPAKSHRSRTLQGARALPQLVGTELSWLGAKYGRKSTLKQAFRILASGDIVKPDTSKQAQECVHGRRGQRERNFTTVESITLCSSSQDAGISCSERLLDIYGRLA